MRDSKPFDANLFVGEFFVGEKLHANYLLNQEYITHVAQAAYNQGLEDAAKIYDLGWGGMCEGDILAGINHALSLTAAQARALKGTEA